MAVRLQVSAGFAVLLGLMLTGCSTIERVAYTPSDAARAEVPGISDARFSGDAPASVFDRFRRDVAQQAAARHEAVSYLALSGGGGDGAFGSGFLKGLTETGHRPSFTIVSGVSTGALMAPFAFLGADYDSTLQSLYTDGYAETLVSDVNIINGLFGNALVDSDKLGKLIKRYVTPEIMQQVAAEHRKGRRLLIATTDLDSQRSQIWNMGAIANSGAPNALALFRQVLAASASVPGLFPPRLINVEADGRAFQEMHVDGGTLRQLYVAPDEVIYGENGGSAHPDIKDLYILVNNKIDPTFDIVKDATVSVGARSLETILKREGRNNVLSAYAYATRNHIGYHLAYIGPEVREPAADNATEGFSKEYMSYLFGLGEERGRSGRAWDGTPPLAHEPVVQKRPGGQSSPLAGAPAAVGGALLPTAFATGG